MKKLLGITSIVVMLFSQCGNDEGNAEPALTAEFSHSLSNNGFVPATLSLNSQATADIYNWFVNDIQIGFGPSITYEITKESFYLVKHEAIRDSKLVTNTDTLWVYDPKFASAETLPTGDINCQSFTFMSITFSFETAAADGFHFDQGPAYYPEGDPVLGTDTVFSLFRVDHLVLYDPNVTDETGDGIYSLNVDFETEKVDLKFNYKFYIRIDQGCISSVKAIDQG